MVFTDTHCHLYLDAFDNDREQVVHKAIDQNVNYMLLPNIDSQSVEPMLKLSKSFPEHCFPMMGLHPTSVKENYKEELEIVTGWHEKKKFIAVGEIGIDLYWDKTYIREQEIALSRQLQIAKDQGLPVVIHSRDSLDEILDIIDQENTENLTGVFHAFTGDAGEAHKIIDRGFMIGAGGILTFKNSQLASTLKDIDLEHILLETDSPYLAPVPRRGKRNESSYIRFIAEKLAEVKNLTVEEVAETTTSNCIRLFNLD